ncbi:MAG: hypothetical protein ACK52Z_18235 [Acidobacteriota bacterium]
MADSKLLIIMTVFVALCALSQLGQMVAFFGLLRKVKSLQAEVRPLISKAEETLETARVTLEQGRQQMLEISQRTNKILDSAQGQLEKIDVVVTEASDRALVQLERVDLMVGETVEKVQSLVATTQEGLMRPLREVSAVVAAVRGAFGFLFKSRTPSGAPAPQDEEMVI